MAAAGEYADEEKLLTQWLPTAVDGVRALTDLPADLLAALAANPGGIVQVWSYSGTVANAAQDRPAIDLNMYVGPDPSGEPDREACRALASRVMAAVLYDLPNTTHTLGGLVATVQGVVQLQRPVARFYDESPVRRRHATVRLILATRSA